MNIAGWDTFKQDELICLSTGGSDNLIIPCLLLRGRSARSLKDGHEKPPQHASTLLIYCHANSEDLGSIYPCAQWLCQMMGVHVLVPEYPGYGLCTGNPCEDTVNRAVLAACTFAKDALRWDQDHILIYGRSIGTGPALNAARFDSFSENTNCFKLNCESMCWFVFNMARVIFCTDWAELGAWFSFPPTRISGSDASALRWLRCYFDTR